MWQWLELHGATLQAIGSLVAAFLGFITIPVLVMTYFAARHAARAASEQAAAAMVLTEVSRAQQRAAERAAVAAEAQVAAAEASTTLARQQLLAAQESAAAERVHSELIRQQTLATLQPLLSFGRRYSTHVSWTVLENQSTAIAFDVTAHNGTPANPGNPISVSLGTLAPGAEAQLRGIDYSPLAHNPFGEEVAVQPVPVFARYRSLDGRQFYTAVDLATDDRHQTMKEES